MDLYIYTDESGVFDKVHNKLFVFGGVMYLSKEDRDIATRKYINVEKNIYSKGLYSGELKASIISNKDKGKIFRSLNDTIKFGVIIHQRQVDNRIFNDKKSKQRFLDYAYKIMIKRTFQSLEHDSYLKLEDIENINIYCDEHTTATNGRYELKEGIISELKTGTYNYRWTKFYPPICSQIKNINLGFYDSKNRTLIRAADVVANRIYASSINKDKYFNINKLREKVLITFLP